MTDRKPGQSTRRPHGMRLALILLLCVSCCLFAWSQQQQRGKASYYSKKATGARTASGERLHHDSMTCAHRFYPFGTMLKVTNLTNKKTVVVRVTDRGPFRKGRVIDLSWGAAKAIDMLRQGIVTVKVEVVDDNQIPMRPNDSIDLPKIDFELAESVYNFNEDWKEGVADDADIQVNFPAKMPEQKSKATTTGNKKKSVRQPQPKNGEKHHARNKAR